MFLGDRVPVGWWGLGLLVIFCLLHYLVFVVLFVIFDVAVLLLVCCVTVGYRYFLCCFYC